MLRRVFCKLLLVAIVIFSLLALSSAVLAQGRSEEAFQRVKAVQERHTLKLMAKKGVVGTAIGLNDKGKHVVMVFLEKPGVAGIPKELEGIPVKQKVSGKIYALKPPTNKPPKKPSGLTATALSTSEIYLDWRDNRDRDLSHYNVYSSVSAGGPYDYVDTVYISSYSDTGLAAGMTYYYVVTAVDTDGNKSADSEETSATTDSIPGTPPDAPTGLTATPAGSTQINLSWTDNSDNETGFKIERDSVQIDTVGVDVTNYSDFGLNPSTIYTYRVRAYNNDGNSGYSDEASATTEDAPVDTIPPAAPSDLDATAISSSQINLDWNDNSEPDLLGYNVYRSTTSGTPYSYVDSVTGSAYSDSGLTSSTTYYYVVTAVDTSDNESGPSNESSDTTDSGAVEHPPLWCERPVPIGVSTGHPAITAGTIGCRLKDLSGNIFALSNNHVYADENLASIDDNVLQPGTFDDGVNPDDAIGTLTAFEPIKFYPPFVFNTIDAAIAKCSEATLGNSTPEGGYGIPNSTTTGAYIGQAVQKYGRTTGLTKGTVVAVNGAFFVGYGTGSAIFVDQIVVEPGGFSDGGDSGSLVVTDDLDCNPVGLLFAGSSTQTIVNPIDAVLGAFSGVSIDGK